jgi:trehalose/maltose hydrolase-like predicted phosphorylase
MAARIVVQPPNAAGVIPQFDGFLELPDPLPETGEAEAPGYQLLKQADFIVLPVLLPERYSPEAVDVNYRYYEPRTQHGSTLSLGMHGLVAATLGRTDEAYRMFQRTAYADLHNTMGSASGLHAACTAMIPRTVMEGFAGLRIVNGKPVAVPHLPDGWTEVEFQFVHRGRPYLCRVTASDRGRTVPCAPANQ